MQLEILKSSEEKFHHNFKRKLSELIKFKKSVSGCLICGADSIINTPLDERRIIEIQCQGVLGYDFCELSPDIESEIEINDYVIISFSDFLEIARVKNVGELVKIKRQRLGMCNEKLPIAKRKMTPEDMEKYNQTIEDEKRAKIIFFEKINKYELDMKLINVHYQFDRKKLFFFYTADGRVDFRELARDLALEFRTRIELRQIGVRDEAKRIGGIGTCGREYCCSSYLSSFKKIAIKIASEQNISSNITKLSGPCGKLKCCLSYEFEENNEEANS